MPLGGGVFDWSKSQLMKDVIQKIKKYHPVDTDGNPSSETYNELEIMELIEMVKDNEEEIKKSQFVKWLFSKSFMTLAALMGYMNQ
jgi:hypothetical protein